MDRRDEIIDNARDEISVIMDETYQSSIYGEETDVRRVLEAMFDEVYNYAKSETDLSDITYGESIEKYATDEEKEFLEGCSGFHPKKKKDKKKKKKKKDK